MAGTPCLPMMTEAPAAPHRGKPEFHQGSLRIRRCACNYAAAVDVLFGRDELAARAAAVLAGSGVCHLVGPPGVGTTALARAVAGAIDAEQVVWVDAAGLEPPALLWAALLDPFELEPTPAEPAATTLRAALTGRPVLVVIDGAGPELAAVADSVPAGASGPWLITTSTLLPRGFDAGVVRVRPLPTVAADGRSPAEALFRHHYAHTGGTGDVDAHPSEIGAILSETGGLPVAIRIAAARAALLGFDPAHHRAGPIGPVDRAVRRSIDRLDEAALALLTGLGSADRIVPLDLAAELSGLDGAELGAAVEVLARHSLVEPVDGGVEILTPVRVAVRRLAELRGTAAIADRRHRAWAARRCAGAVGTAGVAELVALAPELRLAISRSLEQPGAVAEAIAVGAALAEALDTVLRHRQALAVLETLLTAVGASDVPTDDVIELRLLVALGRIHIHGGAAGERELERAAASVAAAERPDRALAGIATLRAATAFERGDLDSALDLALAAADAAANVGEDGRRLAALVQVADVHLVAGRLADADDAAAIVGGAGAIDEWLAGLGRAARAMWRSSGARPSWPARSAASCSNRPPPRASATSSSRPRWCSTPPIPPPTAPSSKRRSRIRATPAACSTSRSGGSGRLTSCSTAGRWRRCVRRPRSSRSPIGCRAVGKRSSGGSSSATPRPAPGSTGRRRSPTPRRSPWRSSTARRCVPPTPSTVSPICCRRGSGRRPTAPGRRRTGSDGSVVLSARAARGAARHRRRRARSQTAGSSTDG